ncbi:AfsR/SARP family transcriptional regulator [Streptomyces venezuelae]|uniref:AfsR/SARP family transcriptional regulator n=1 Tax=Streptomyces venezuelae TaxID=54571 RepID=UPI0037DD7D26
MPDFAALLADPAGTARLSPGTSAFAVLVSPFLDRLYGGTRAIGSEPADTADRAPSAHVRFTVFGPELAWRGDEPVPVGTPAQQAVLAVLLLRGRRFVTPAELAYALSEGENLSPFEAYELDEMRDRVSSIGQLLAPWGVVVESAAPGFRLRADGADEAVGAIPRDLAEAERLHAEAKAAYAAGDAAAAMGLLGEAVGGLVGTPLDGVPGVHAEAQRTRLAEWRLMLVESRIELALELGRYEDVVPELTRLTAAHPLRERLRAQLMVALYGSGRTAEALAVYADTRRLLGEEVGVDPFPPLDEVHRRILHGEPPDRVRAPRHAPLAAPDTRAVPPWPPAEGLSFGVLGPVRAWRDAEPLPTGSPQQRAFLALLLLREGRIVTASEAIDAIWGEDPPSHALATVRTYASRVRKAYGPETLLTESGAYAVRVPPGALDLHAARELAAESERARGLGDLHRARDLLTQSLALWAGEALAGVPGPYAGAQRAQLEQWRVELLETRLDMDLEAGTHAEAVPELTALTAAHPLRERLRELLMLALYRCGRQAEALAVYADTRRLLADELGVDPSPDLQRLQRRILDADDALFGPPPSASGPPHAAPLRPELLPARVPDFTGRTELLGELARHLTTPEGSGPAVSVIAGIGGVGKTTLAVQVAHEVRPHFPDGRLYVDLDGAGPRPADPAVVLGAFLRALGTPDSAIAPGLADRAAQFRAALDGRRVLVVLDNARDAAQVRPLLPGAAGCAVLVTSRVHMAGLPGARLVELDVMSAAEALHLFTRIVGDGRVAPERDAAVEVVTACGFLPLAVRIVAARLAARRTWPVAVLAAKLADETRRLDELRAGDLSVSATFELGYGWLEPDQRRAFRLLALADGPDISLAAAAAVLNLPPHRTERLLEALVDTCMLDSSAPGRFRYHSLLRLYARACAERDELPPAECEMARSRLLDFYLATACNAYAIEHPGDRLVAHMEPTTHPGLTFSDSREALNWLHAEADCLLACAGRSTGRELLSRAVDLLWLAQDISESGTHALAYASTARILRSATEAEGVVGRAGRAALILAEAELGLGAFDAAREGAELALRRTFQDPPVDGRAAVVLAAVALHQSRDDDAERHFTEAFHAFRSDEDRAGEAGVLCTLSRMRLDLGDAAGALGLAEEAVALFESLGPSVRGGDARYAQGLALTHTGRHSEAQAALHRAREVFRSRGAPSRSGSALFRSAVVELLLGEPEPAAAHTAEALERVGVSGGPWRRGSILVVRGHALHALGRADGARACWREALTLFEGIGTKDAQPVRELLGDTVTSSPPDPG